MTRSEVEFFSSLQPISSSTKRMAVNNTIIRFDCMSDRFLMILPTLLPPLTLNYGLFILSFLFHGRELLIHYLQ